MLLKIYAKSEFFQNSCMKRDQNYLLNTVFLNPNYFSLYRDKLVLLLVCFLFCSVFFFSDVWIQTYNYFFFILQSESVSSYIKGLIDCYASSFKEMRKSA